MAPGVVVTNAHVIAMDFLDQISVQFPASSNGTRQPLPATLLWADKQRDLALLWIDDSVGQPLPLAAPGRLPRGTPVTAIGNPSDQEVKGIARINVVTQGVVKEQAWLEGQLYYTMAVEIYPGSSGGPCLNARGEVVGVVTAKAKKHAYCAPVEAVHEAMNQLARAQDYQTAANQAAGKHQAELLAARLIVAGDLAVMALAPSEGQSRKGSRSGSSSQSQADGREAAWWAVHQFLIEGLAPIRYRVKDCKDLPADVRYEAEQLAATYMTMRMIMQPIPNYFPATRDVPLLAAHHREHAVNLQRALQLPDWALDQTRKLIGL